ncbi:ACP S-malonyltransferase [uncultured Bacteroides sp.]|uniref:ACP S-malonyltransferase n=1 Tax=uncultured Bacteroides sp. TaxID=162156 RepID=UPI0025F7173C|nr:ACP S-malonyltransferase [uncultured Bacteroides sp.]
MKAFVFSGQSSQKFGMGKDLYEKCPKARAIFEQANDILGERFSDFMFNASEDVLMDTRYTQPAIFIYQVAAALGQDSVLADCTAGHSLGEYAALVVAGALSFDECLPFIKTRGQVFYDAFQRNPSAMGAVIAVPDEQVREVLKQVSEEDGNKLYVANYNGPGQLVITGARESVKKACKVLKGMGAKRALVLPQKGVGHSPNSAEEGRILGEELKKMHWMTPRVPIYQDADGLPHTDPAELLDNEIKLMTYPVQWTGITMNMKANGVTEWYEVGCDDTLQKIVSRMVSDLTVKSIWDTPEYQGVKPYEDPDFE